MLNMLLSPPTGDKQNDLALFDFQKNKKLRFIEKQEAFCKKCLYRILVDVARNTYVKLANFQTQPPLSRNCFVFNTSHC